MRLLVAMALTLWVLPAAAEPVQVFVEDVKVELDGWDARKAEALGKALAADLQGAIVKNPAYSPMTFENLESQLRKEKRAEQMSCSKSDQACIQKILDNYGCEERLYGIVRQVGEEVQVTLTRYQGQRLVGNGAASDYAKPEAKAIREVATRLAQDLFGGPRSPAAGGRKVEEMRLGKTVEDWNPEVEAGFVVEFASEPADALVEVDGAALCQTPCSKELTKGPHRVSLKKARYQGWEGSIDPATTKRLSEKLAPTFGWLTVRSTPAGLAVTLNGKPGGTTPIEAKEMDPGPYNVMVTDNAYEDEGQRVSLEAGGNKVVTLLPKPKEGALKVSVVDDKGNAVAAEVTIDGKRMGTAPWVGKLQVGQHAVAVRALDGRTTEKAVTVAYHQVATENLQVLSNASPQLAIVNGTSSVGQAFDRGQAIQNALTDDSGFLTITTEPTGATLFLNGKEIGSSPKQIETMVGKYVVTAELGRLYHAGRQDLDLTTAGANVKLELPAAFGALEVTSTPSGAEVWLDGERVGATPYRDNRCVSGTHALAVSLVNYLPFKGGVTVKDGQTTATSVRLGAAFK